jgi:hypothetical protein
VTADIRCKLVRYIGQIVLRRSAAHILGEISSCLCWIIRAAHRAATLSHNLELRLLANTNVASIPELASRGRSLKVSCEIVAVSARLGRCGAAGAATDCRFVEFGAWDAKVEMSAAAVIVIICPPLCD